LIDKGACAFLVYITFISSLYYRAMISGNHFLFMTLSRQHSFLIKNYFPLWIFGTQLCHKLLN